MLAHYMHLENSANQGGSRKGWSDRRATSHGATQFEGVLLSRRNACNVMLTTGLSMTRVWQRERGRDFQYDTDLTARERAGVFQ